MCIAHCVGCVSCACGAARLAQIGHWQITICRAVCIVVFKTHMHGAQAAAKNGAWLREICLYERCVVQMKQGLYTA